MPRRARLKLAGYPQHIVQRGHNRSVCFRQHSDFALYLGLLQELVRRFDCHMHAFVLMSNHVPPQHPFRPGGQPPARPHGYGVGRALLVERRGR